MPHHLALIVPLTSVVLTAACSNSPTDPRCLPPGSFISMNVSCNSLVGSVLKCRAVTRNYCQDETDVTLQALWQSSDSGIVSVSSTGVVQSVSPGDAQVSAKFQGSTSFARVRVLPNEPPLPVADLGAFVRRAPTCGINDGISGALVTIIEGVNTGLTATTDSHGLGMFPNVPFGPTIALRASKEGYEDKMVNGTAGYPPGIPDICMTAIQ
jgi:hypothetical protein